MRFKTLIGTLGFAVVIGAASNASASTITCPNPVFEYGNGPNKKISNTYTVTPAVDCVWGALGTQHLGNEHDDFLDGEGVNDAEYGNTGPTFGLSWTLVGSTEGVSAANLGSIGGLTFSNFTGTLAEWAVDPTNANLFGYNVFALGVKDGADPKWAVFLLDSTQLNGTVSMTGGTFSHFTLYAATRTVPDVPVPEPTSLLLLASGMAVATSIRKRRRTR